jgi:hypothetical protein
MVDPTQTELIPAAKALMQDPNIHPLAQAIHRKEVVKEEEVTSLKKAGAGGQGDVYFLDGMFCAKLCYEFATGMEHPTQG